MVTITIPPLEDQLPAFLAPAIKTFALLYGNASKLYSLTAEAIRGPMNLMTISTQGMGMDVPKAAQ
jgi:hypothetical protein